MSMVGMIVVVEKDWFDFDKFGVWMIVNVLGYVGLLIYVKFVGG